MERASGEGKPPPGSEHHRPVELRDRRRAELGERDGDFLREDARQLAQSPFPVGCHGVEQRAADHDEIGAGDIGAHDILAAADAQSKILFICSPNNPSGNKVKREDIYFLLDHFPGIVVVDEAYIDFSSEPSLIKVLEQYPNLLVMQTFSKAWGLASLRLGMAFSSPELIGILNQIKPPYNISGLTHKTPCWQV